MPDRKRKKPLVPKLRFPEFRDAGEWEEKRLGEVATILKGKNIGKADIASNGLLSCIRYGELYTYYGETINEVISHTDLSPDDLMISHAGDVIIPASGETSKDIATASCVMFDGIALGGDINIIRSNVNGVFLAYYLRGAKRAAIERIAQGISVVHLYPGQLKILPLGIPDQKEQQKIADCLSSLDTLIELEAQRCEALKAHKKGLMQQLFPREGETTPRLRFPGFRDAEEWEVYALGTLCNLQDGFAFSSNIFVDEATDAMQVIRITDINNKNRNQDKVYIPISFLNKLNLDKYLVNQGDLLLSLTGAAGFNFLLWNGDKAVLNQRTLKITPLDSKNNYLRWLLEPLLYEKINSFGTGQNNNLSKDILSSISVRIPKLEEQRKIADCLSSLDKLIELQSRKVEALKQHKKGLMQQLFPQEVI